MSGIWDLVGFICCSLVAGALAGVLISRVGDCPGGAEDGAAVAFVIDGAPAAPAPTPAPTAPAAPIPLAPPPAAADFEARIGARRFADGRVEFALQPRSGDGWGARMLPSAGYFPASAAAGRWLNSSSVTIGGAEARISARKSPTDASSSRCRRAPAAAGARVCCPRRAISRRTPPPDAGSTPRR